MTSRRIEEEKNVVEQMIRLYCLKSEGHGELCPSCRELLTSSSSDATRQNPSELGFCSRCYFGWIMPTVGLTDAVTVRISLPARNAPHIAIDLR